MNLKEKFDELKIKLSDSCLSNSRDFEFNNDKEMYRLYFVYCYTIGNGYSNNVGITEWPFMPFKLPSKMTMEEAFKILSYLTDFIEKNLKLEANSYESVKKLDDILNLERLGFTKLNIKIGRNSDNVINLFNISGRRIIFKKSRRYQKYFKWYTEGITFNEVRDIYSKYEIDFYDLTLKEIKKDIKVKKLHK